MFQRIDLADEVLLAAFLPPEHRQSAEILVRRFGGIADVVYADAFMLRDAGADDCVISALVAVRETLIRASRAKVARREGIRDWSEIAEFCRCLIGREPVTHLAALALDGKRRLISHAVLLRGMTTPAECRPRMVAEFALRSHASAVAICRNDIDGEDCLTGADRKLADAIDAALRLLGIPLYDYLVVSPCYCASYLDRREGR